MLFPKIKQIIIDNNIATSIFSDSDHRKNPVLLIALIIKRKRSIK